MWRLHFCDGVHTSAIVLSGQVCEEAARVAAGRAGAPGFANLEALQFQQSMPLQTLILLEILCEYNPPMLRMLTQIQKVFLN